MILKELIKSYLNKYGIVHKFSILILHNEEVMCVHDFIIFLFKLVEVLYEFESFHL